MQELRVVTERAVHEQWTAEKWRVMEEAGREIVCGRLDVCETGAGDIAVFFFLPVLAALAFKDHTR